jgi:zinc and cadmium transporter
MNLPAETILFNAAIVTMIWIGVWVALRGFKSPKFVRLAVSLSAGVLLGVAFVHMIPEAVELMGAPSTGLLVLLGYLVIYALERFVMVHPCEEAHCDYHAVGLAAFIGLSIHSLMGGIALGSALLVPGLAWAVFVATLLHKAPEAFSLTTLLVMGKRPIGRVALYIAVFSLMLPLGSWVAVSGLNHYGIKVVGGAVALSAGTFVYIATGDLLSGTHSKGQSKAEAALAFLLGIGFALMTKWFEH